MRERWGRQAGRILWIAVPVATAVATVAALGILTTTLMARMLGGPQ